MRGLHRIGMPPRIAVEWMAEGAAGPLVLCLHGIGGNRHMWAEQLPALAAEFTVAAWDARGYLDSDDYEGPLLFRDFSNDVARVLDFFGVERAHLVGSSMGGRIALDFFAHRPNRVASLTLADTSAGSELQARPEKIEEFLALRRKPLLEGRTPSEIAPAIVRNLVAPDCEPRIFAAAVDMVGSLRPESYLKALETVTRFTEFPDLAGIDVPALVIVGEHDRIATPEHAAHMAHRLPRSTLRVLKGAGHLSNMEAPGAFNAALREFLLPIRERAPATPLHTLAPQWQPS